MYSFESRIRYSETDAQGRLTAEKLIDYFQDCSTFQSEDGGIGVEQLRAQGLAWIIVYWRVEIRRMPRLGERILTGTFPYEMKGSIGLRNFFMKTQDGELLAAANSVWSLVSTKTMRPVRIPAGITRAYPLEERLDMQYDARKITVPASGGQMRTPVVVKEYHLDTNRHMNNGQYVRIAEGFLPDGQDPSVLRIEYRRQAVLGDRITPVVFSDTDPDGAASAAGLQQNRQEEEGTPDGRTGDDLPRTVCISLNADDGKPYAILEAAY